MTIHFQNELERLKKKLLALSAIVEESVERAVRSISNRDIPLAREVIENDRTIDLLEVEVEEECLKILALHQPVAGDLRFVVAVLKINNDLERIGDLAVNIAERSAYLAEKEPIAMPFDFVTMEKKTRLMLEKSIDSLIQMNIEVANEVGAADDEIDAINREMYNQVAIGVRNSPDQADRLIHCLSISRHLERIADYATNIAEDVIYMIKGQIIRHQPEEY
ncbi:Phosphate transport system regulatory protein PhoU [hydrothermal vent metagenome]|uniref:Phosphate transport system regulatory protein PhoU n=1 Tax=hydrothermal vent metagenome TaxID=652676 RepID=A0A3B1CS22_9ZZZZ